jgi:hypothetical protein
MPLEPGGKTHSGLAHVSIPVNLDIVISWKNRMENLRGIRTPILHVWGRLVEANIDAYRSIRHGLMSLTKIELTSRARSTRVIDMASGSIQDVFACEVVLKENFVDACIFDTTKDDT